MYKSSLLSIPDSKFVHIIQVRSSSVFITYWFDGSLSEVELANTRLLRFKSAVSISVLSFFELHIVDSRPSFCRLRSVFFTNWFDSSLSEVEQANTRLYILYLRLIRTLI